MVTDSSSATPERLSVTTRERMVSSSWPRFSQVRRNSALAGGSSRILRRAFCACSVIFCASASRNTRLGGPRWAECRHPPATRGRYRYGRNGRPPSPPRFEDIRMGTRRRFAAAWADAAGFFALSGTNGGHGRQPGQCAPPGAGWPFKEQGMRKPPPSRCRRRAALSPRYFRQT